MQLNIPSINNILAITINHKRASLDDVGALEHRVEEAYQHLYPYTDEIVILTTCNRFEIYAYTSNPDELLSHARSLLCHLWGKALVLHGMDAVKHLFRVAAGLESMIVGETEILSQVRKAYDYARDNAYAGRLLGLLFSRAIHAGKRVRSETRISVGNVGFPGAAVRLAERIFGGLDGKTVVVVGAGEAGKIIATLVRERYKSAEIVIVNRTIERALKLAELVSGVGYGLEALPTLLEKADVVFIAVTAREPILQARHVKNVHSRLVVIDISVPPAVDESARKRITYYGLEDVKRVVDEIIAKRLTEVPKAEKIIEEELHVFRKLWARRVADEAIREVMRYAEKVVEEEIAEAMARLRVTGFDGAAASVVEAMAKSLVKKLLRPLIVYMHETAQLGENRILSAISEAFKREFSKRLRATGK